jgi:hypothetical protein
VSTITNNAAQIESTIFNREPVPNRVFPHQIIYTTDNSVETCLNQCAAFGFPAAGLEVRSE